MFAYKGLIVDRLQLRRAEELYKLRVEPSRLAVLFSLLVLPLAIVMIQSADQFLGIGLCTGGR